MLREVEEDFEGNDREFKKFQPMLEEYETSLYSDWKEGHKKLCSTLDLLQWKVTNSMSM